MAIDGNSVLFAFEGSGRVTSKKTNLGFGASISLKAYYNSKIEISMQSYDMGLLKIGTDRDLEECSFIGKLSNGYEIKIGSFYVNSCQMKGGIGKPVICSLVPFLFSDVVIWNPKYGKDTEIFNTKGICKVGLTNFLFEGNITSRYNGGVRTDVIFQAKIDNIDMNLQRLDKYNEIESFLRNTKEIMVTSELIIEKANPNEGNYYGNDICWLTSYSQKTLISMYYTHLYIEENEALLVLHSQKMYSFANSKFIETYPREEHDIQIFLEQTYDKFRRNKSKLKLDNIIDIICQAELAKIMESKYLLLSSALNLFVEVICKESNLQVDDDDGVINNYKGAITKYLRSRGVTLDQEHIDNLAKKLADHTFKKKIAAVIKFLDFHYSSEDIQRIVKNRNKIVHEVRFHDYTKNLEDYHTIKMLIDKIMLKILEYKGNVLNYSKKNYPREDINSFFNTL